MIANILIGSAFGLTIANIVITKLELGMQKELPKAREITDKLTLVTLLASAVYIWELT